MPLAALRNLHITIIYPNEYFIEKEWTRSKIEQWVKVLQGTVSSRLTDHTTHVVLSAKDWREQGDIVQEIDARNEKNAKPAKHIKIVSASWLREVLTESKKVKESTYLWSKIEPVAMEGKSKQTVAKGKNTKGVLGPSAMTNLLADSTENFLDPKEHRKIERQVREQERLKNEAEEEKERELRKKKEDVKKILDAEKKKATSAGISDQWHVYVDSTGFSYSIKLTKVDVARNKNGVREITIYESNVQPHTYATNLSHSGALTTMDNKLLVAVGSNFQTAMHAFKECFTEQTDGLSWDTRFTDAVERFRQERLDKAHRRVKNIKHGARGSDDATPGILHFRYDPPRYGPRGVLTALEKKKFPEIGPRDRGFEAGKKGETRGDIELWMSGGNPPAVEMQLPAQGNSLGAASAAEEGQMMAVEPEILPPAPAVPEKQITSHEIIEQAMAEGLAAQKAKEDAEYDLAFGRHSSNYETQQSLVLDNGQEGRFSPNSSALIGIGENNSNSFEDLMNDMIGEMVEEVGDRHKNGGEMTRSYGDTLGPTSEQHTTFEEENMASVPETQSFDQAATMQSHSTSSFDHTQAAQDALDAIQYHVDGGGPSADQTALPSSEAFTVEDASSVGMQARTPKVPSKVSLGLNLGSSMLGKRKVVDDEDTADGRRIMLSPHSSPEKVQFDEARN